MELEDFLAHYGIRGMHWGVRRSTDSSGHVKGKGTDSKSGDPVSAHPDGGHPSDSAGTTAASSADHKRATDALAKAEAKGPSALSNDEIKALTSRLESEKKFHQLTGNQVSDLQKKVDQMELEKRYNKLLSEKKMANRSTARKIIDTIVGSASKAASDQAAAYGKKLVEDMIQQSGNKKAQPTPKKASMPFKVNPAKVKVSSRPMPSTIPRIRN